MRLLFVLILTIIAIVVLMRRGSYWMNQVKKGILIRLASVRKSLFPDGDYNYAKLAIKGIGTQSTNVTIE